MKFSGELRILYDPTIHNYDLQHRQPHQSIFRLMGQYTNHSIQIEERRDTEISETVRLRRPLDQPMDPHEFDPQTFAKNNSDSSGLKMKNGDKTQKQNQDSPRVEETAARPTILPATTGEDPHGDHLEDLPEDHLVLLRQEEVEEENLEVLAIITAVAATTVNSGLATGTAAEEEEEVVETAEAHQVMMEAT